MCAFNEDGDSDWSNESNDQWADVVWPIPDTEATHEILQGYQDGNGGAGTNGFHDGVDYQAGAGGQDVVAPRGGWVFLAFSGDDPGEKNYKVEIVIDVGEGLEEDDDLGHFSNTPLSVKPGDYVHPGQKLGTVTSTVWNAPWNHIHQHCPQRPRSSPLIIFDTDAARDPSEQEPAVEDGYDEGTEDMLYKVDGTASDDCSYYGYDEMTHALSGDIDIIAEVHDEMGPAPPKQGPLKLGYWIEGPSGVDLDDVKSADHPYMLCDFRAHSFSHAETDVSAAVFDTCADRDQRPHIPNSYPWPNFHHYVITNCKGESGAPEDIDDGQCWNTDAKDDGAAVTSPHANYAGMDDATKPSEARFPDGEYNIHVLMWDVIHGPVNAVREVRVANFGDFPPFVRRVELLENVDDDDNTGADPHVGYERKVYSFDHQAPSPYPGQPGWLDAAQQVAGGYAYAASRRGGRNLWLRVTFSKSMDKNWDQFSVQYDPQGAGGAALLDFTGVPGGPWSTIANDDDTWTGTATIPEPTGDSPALCDSKPGANHDLDAVIRIKARDRDARGLDDDDDGVAQEDSTDDQHMFKIETRQDQPAGEAPAP